MKCEHNVALSEYTTFRLGGECQNLYIPETTEELVQLLNELPEPRYLLSGGSNLLINDKRIFENVILLREFDNRIEDLGNGLFYSGGSVRIQRLIRFVNERGYGGIEFLFSLPALVGGIVTMNAGRGNKRDLISNFVVKVKVWHNGKITEMSKDECGFGHRTSVFKNNSMVVLGVYLQLVPGEREDFENKCKERIQLSTQKQDASRPNFGSVFCVYNWRILALFRILSSGKSGVHYSKKTNNWLINNQGSFDQAMHQIDMVKKIHKLLHLKCETEVIIWK